MESLISKISKKYQERNSNIQREKAALEKQKNIVARKMDNLYISIENGSADEYDIERLNKAKKEMTSIKTRLLELESKSEFFLQPQQVVQVINRYIAALKNKKSPDDIRALLSTFINKITVHSTVIMVQFKINFCDIIGAGEGT